MAGRKSRVTGVGRGNGPGSARGQFEEGMPSGNPNGRPRKQKLPPTASLSDALQRALRKMIDVQENGVRSQMPIYQAMIEVMLDGFRSAPASQQLRILEWCKQNAPEMSEPGPCEPNWDSAGKVLAELAAEAKREGLWPEGYLLPVANTA